MAKRLTRGERHYRSLRDLNVDFDADPYAEPLVRDPLVEETDVVVVGSGWAGMSTAAHLTKQGITSYRIIDKAGDFGGTWYWNRYPGCMCDVESYTYLPLLEEVGYMPTKKYAHAQEIFEYAQMLGRHFDMYPHALFQTEVTGVVWQDDVERWLVTTSRGDQLSARFVVICGGVLHKAKLPGIPGIERFDGPLLPHQPLGLRLHRRRPRRADGQAARQGRRHHRHRRDGRAGRAQARRGGQAPLRLPAHPVDGEPAKPARRPTRSGFARCRPSRAGTRSAWRTSSS